MLKSLNIQSLFCLNAVDQKRFDRALISMPSCLVSSAYSGNPFYKDLKSLKKWAQEQYNSYGSKDSDCLITNNDDFRRVSVWLEFLNSL